eukprot:1245635-Prymnesium_polylepis.1
MSRLEPPTSGAHRDPRPSGACRAALVQLQDAHGLTQQETGAETVRTRSSAIFSAPPPSALP